MSSLSVPVSNWRGRVLGQLIENRTRGVCFFWDGEGGRWWWLKVEMVVVVVWSGKDVVGRVGGGSHINYKILIIFLLTF
ncbi:hypothetical protein Hanom_Chr03g00191421 [Helianthus anomalus]